MVLHKVKHNIIFNNLYILKPNASLLRGTYVDHSRVLDFKSAPEENALGFKRCIEMDYFKKSCYLQMYNY